MGQIDELARLLWTLKDWDVVDVGAGDGGFAAELAARGARVIGLEVEAGKVARAQAAHGDVAQFLQGYAEALPLPDYSADLMTFIHSFHHIPQAHYGAATDEAMRVLRIGGRLHVAEPDLDGNVTQIVQPLDDETEVRTAAAAHLRSLPNFTPLVLVEQSRIVLRRRCADFDALARNLIGVSPDRAAAFPAARAEMRARFDRLSERDEAGFTLTQPVTIYHFQKT
ncbi:MAG: class I SAM-dependent methyltransferase [Aestuariivita sp.]|uniref:class I SAM-dependent methyltransferase n=1 Tax=Aestuariivita sp. TaxID=1872407 RepID=UPI003BAE75EA